MRMTTLVAKNLTRRKGRTALTVSGVAVAVAAVVSLAGLAHGYQESLNDLYSRRGVELLVFRAGVADRLHSNINARVGDKLRALPHVRDVTALLIDLVSFEQANLVGVAIQGWPPDSFLFDDLRVVAGRRFSPDDRRATMLGTILAKNLGKQTGDRLAIEGEDFEIVGIYESFNAFENGTAILNLHELQELMDRPNQVTGFEVRLNDVPDRQAVVTDLRARIDALSDEKGRSYKLSALPARDHAASAMQIRLGHAVAWMTTAIALLVGVIGTLNTMLMAVLERTREIGILRAIGWARRRVLQMILLEALVLSATGAALGMLLAVASLRGLNALPAAQGLVWGGGIGLTAFVQGGCVALLIGLLGGLYPAYRAGRLLPTEALRHD